MLKTITSLLLMSLILLGCSGKQRDKNELYFEDFGWTITIPESFGKVREETWGKVQDRGQEAMGAKKNPGFKTLFVYSAGTNSFIEANTEPHVGTIADYNTTIQTTYNAFEQALHNNFPGSEVNTSRSTETIGGKEFSKFDASTSGSPLHVIVYSRLFGKNAFTVSIMDDNESSREEMLKVFRNSKFE